MDILGCGFNGFNQLLPPRPRLDHNVDTSRVLTLTKIHSMITGVSGRAGSGAYSYSVYTHPEFTNQTSERPTESLNTISIGWDKIAFLFDDGHVLTLPSSPSPSVANTPRIIAKSVSVTWRNTFAVDWDGECVKLDYSTPGGSTVVKRATTGDSDSGMFLKVASGDFYSMVLSDSFKVWQMNDQDGCQILRPISIHEHIKSVSCGKEHVLLLSRIGVVLSMGIGSRGQLGHGDTENQSEPRVVEDLEAVTMLAVCAGGWHSTALSDIGDVYTWGWNESGQLGLPCRTIQERRTAEGKVITDKDDGHSSPKDSSVEAKHHFTPSDDGDKREIMTASDDTKPSASDPSKEVDLEYVNVQTIPVVIDFPCSAGEVMVSRVSCGSRHTAVVTENGEVWTWGWNGYGQLGLGDTISRDVPTRVTAHFTDVQAVHCGYWNTVVVANETK